MDKKLWIRRSTQAILACFCCAEGILTALAYKHWRKEQLLVFMIGSFLLAFFSILGFILEKFLILVFIRCVSYAFYFASSIMLMVFLPSASPNQNSLSLQQFHKVILPLILASMLVVGISLSLDLVLKPTTLHSTSSTFSESKSEATGWHSDSSLVDDLTLNKTHRISTQRPIVCLDLERHSLSEKTLHNKDSEGTLVVPVSTRGDDISFNWLFQASMNTASMYDNNLDNWMSSKPLQLDIEKFEPDKSTVMQHNSLNPTFRSFDIPKSRSSRANFSGTFSIPNKHANHIALHESFDTGTRKFKLPFLTSQLIGESDSTTTTKTLKSPIDQVQNRVDPATQAQSEAFDSSRSALRKLSECNQIILQNPGNAIDQQSNEGIDFPPTQLEFFVDETDRGIHGSNHDVANKIEPVRYSSLSQVPDVTPSSSPIQPQRLQSAFEPSLNSCIQPRSTRDFPESELLDGLEDISMPMPKWSKGTETDADTFQNVSLQDWEKNKDQWLSIRREIAPIMFGSNSRRASTGSISIKSAPSLHTYRDTINWESKESINSFSLSKNKIYRCVTPPQQQTTDLGVPPSRNASPIKKMMSRLKRKDSTVEIKSSPNAKKHKHSASIATSMISAASGFSNKSGSPRKSKRAFFTRSSLDQPLKQHSLSRTDVMSYGSTKIKKPNGDSQSRETIAAGKFWDVDNGDYSDKSRVSSVPSAVIGEYDREKWRTMKTLQDDSTSS